MDKNMTMKFDVDQVKEDERKEVLNYVYNALKE